MMTEWKTSHKVATVLILLTLVAAVSYFAIEVFRDEHKTPQPSNLTSTAGQQVQQANPAPATSQPHAAAPLELHLAAGSIERPSIVATSVMVEAPAPKTTTTTATTRSSEASSPVWQSPPPTVASTEIPLVAAPTPVEPVSQPSPGEPLKGLDTSPRPPSSPAVDGANTSTERQTPRTPANEQPAMSTSTPSPAVLDPEATPSPPERTAADLEAWQEFKLTYNKSYASRDETLKRLNVFIANRRLIEAHNERPGGTFKLAINQMADMSREEINSNFIGSSRSWTGESAAPPSIRIVDEEAAEKRQVDLRNTTAQIVDQGLCRDGSVFAAVASIESSMYSELSRSSSWLSAEALRPTKYSERQVMDHLASQGQGVCSGAISLNHVFEQLTTMPGRLCTAEAYEQLLREELGEFAYKTVGESLRFPRTSADLQQRAHLRGCETGPKLSAFMLVHRDNLLEALMNRGTLAVAVDASQSSFHFYKSGLYMDESCSSDTYNHHVLLVGYEPIGQDGERQAAYLVRNSFGSQWGESGHMRMLREEGRNKCLPHFGIFPVTVADKLPEL